MARARTRIKPLPGNRSMALTVAMVAHRFKIIQVNHKVCRLKTRIRWTQWCPIATKMLKMKAPAVFLIIHPSRTLVIMALLEMVQWCRQGVLQATLTMPKMRQLEVRALTILKMLLKKKRMPNLIGNRHWRMK